MECRVLAVLFPAPTGVVVAATVAILAARNNAVNQSQRRVLAFENLSGRQPWLSDILCYTCCRGFASSGCRAWADFALWATEAARTRWPAAPGTDLHPHALRLSSPARGGWERGQSG